MPKAKIAEPLEIKFSDVEMLSVRRNIKLIDESRFVRIFKGYLRFFV